MSETKPIDENMVQVADHLTVAATYVDAVTGARYVHRDLVEVVRPWQIEEHLGPIQRTEMFGDIESWCAYVQRYGDVLLTGDATGVPLAFLTWSEAGLAAVLDYYGPDGMPTRCQWIAAHRFVKSAAWVRWATLADGKPCSQRKVLEAFEDFAADIVDPDPAALAAMLRTLRATSLAKASTELNADGTSHVVWGRTSQVKSENDLVLPPEITIQIQALKGHTTVVDGRMVPVLYQLPVRLRVSVDDDAKLALRLTMPTAERILENVLADQVARVKELLGDGYTLYRAAP